MEGIKKLVNMGWDALFPRACVICAEEGALLCNMCAHEVHMPHWFLHASYEEVKIFSRISYKEPAVQKLLHAWKYQGDQTAGERWKVWICEGSSPEFFEGSCFVPIPLAREAYAERGFNQAEHLAHALAQKHNGTVLKLLERFPRKAQAKTHKDKRSIMRKINPYTASSTCKALGEAGNVPSRVILVDDVVTTGSTIGACAEVLRDRGVCEVFACTLAFGNAS